MKLRRSMLFVPGANAAMLSTSFVYKPDSVMFDLEDAVSPAREGFRAPAGLPGAAASRLPRHRDGRAHQRRRRRVVAKGPGSGGARRRGHRAPAEDRERARSPGARGRRRADRDGMRPSRGRHEDDGGDRVGVGRGELRGDRDRLAAHDGDRARGIRLCDRHADPAARATEPELFYARCAVLHAARFAKIDAFDVVYGNVNDDDGFLREVEHRQAARLQRQVADQSEADRAPAQRLRADRGGGRLTRNAWSRPPRKRTARGSASCR